jgi:quercetin dioxygenase-like cupin family protein
MTTTRVPFEEMPWQTGAAGVRFKVRVDGGRQLRLVEFTPELSHPSWCLTGHVGYVVDGELEIEFEDRVERYRAGDGVIIPAGPVHGHRPRALSPSVRLIFVEEAPAASGLDGA